MTGVFEIYLLRKGEELRTPSKPEKLVELPHEVRSYLEGIWHTLSVDDRVVIRCDLPT